MAQKPPIREEILKAVAKQRLKKGGNSANIANQDIKAYGSSGRSMNEWQNQDTWPPRPGANHSLGGPPKNYTGRKLTPGQVQTTKRSDFSGKYSKSGVPIIDTKSSTPQAPSKTNMYGTPRMGKRPAKGRF